MCDKVLQVHLSTLHHNMCILTLRVLINLLVGYKVSNVLDQKWAGLRQFPHVRDFFQKILILLISFYFYLFDGK